MLLNLGYISLLENMVMTSVMQFPSPSPVESMIPEVNGLLFYNSTLAFYLEPQHDL